MSTQQAECTYDRYSERYSECDGHHRCTCSPVVSDTGSIVASCACGRSFTLAQFKALPYGGVQRVTNDSELLEMRHCLCNSTICIWVNERGEHTTPPAWAEKRGAA